MKHINKIISGICLAIPFLAASCGDKGEDPISVYGPDPHCTAETDCVDVGKAWLADDADKWVCNIEDGHSEGTCGVKASGK